MRPKVYKLQNFEILGRQRPLRGFEWSKNAFRTEPPPLFCYTCLKTVILSQLNMPKITLKVLLDEHTFYSKILC